LDTVVTPQSNLVSVKFINKKKSLPVGNQIGSPMIRLESSHNTFKDDIQAR